MSDPNNPRGRPSVPDIHGEALIQCQRCGKTSPVFRQMIEREPGLFVLTSFCSYCGSDDVWEMD